MISEKKYGFDAIIGYASGGRFSVPSKQTICNTISKQAAKVENKIKHVLTQPQKETGLLPLLQLQLDCWTRKSYVGSFYGEVVNFYNFDEQRPQQLVIAIDEFKHPHTAARLEERFKEGHQYFGITQDQISLIWTDNASNMMAAEFIDDENFGDNEDGDQEFETFVVSLNADDSLSNQQKHFGDPIHTNNLVSKLSSNNKYKTTAGVLESARQLVKTVNSSSKLTQDWMESCSLVLLGEVATRFDSTYLMLERLCKPEVTGKLPRFIESHPDAVTTNLLPGTHNWREMEALKDLLKPFHQITVLLMGNIASSLPASYITTSQLFERGYNVSQIVTDNGEGYGKTILLFGTGAIF